MPNDILPLHFMRKYGFVSPAKFFAHFISIDETRYVLLATRTFCAIPNDIFPLHFMRKYGFVSPAGMLKINLKNFFLKM